MTLEKLLEGISIEVLAGGVLEGVMVGDTVRVNADVDYRGPRLENVPFRGAICQVILGIWDPIWRNDAYINLPASPDYVSHPLTVDIPITEIGLFPWSPGIFSLFVELRGHPAAGRPQLRDVIEVVLEAEFANFAIVSYDIV